MKMTVNDLFNKADVNWKEMTPGETVDISEKDICVKSLNINTGEVEYRKVLTLVRKDDTPTLRIFNSLTRREFFRASSNHRVYTKIDGRWNFHRLSSLGNTFSVLNEDGEEIIACKEETSLKEPILDFEVEENNNYFANGVLSHNTTPGGKALKFAASIRLEIRKIEFISEKNEIIGLRTRVKGTKNKTAPPMKKQELEIFFGEGFDSDLEWVDFAIKYDIIVQSGAWFTVPGYNDGKLQGKNGVIEWLKKHPEEYNTIIEETKKRMFPKTKREVVLDEDK